MFNPTHFVQTDEAGAKNNHVANGELLELVYAQPRSALTGTQLLTFHNEAGQERTVFDSRVQPFDSREHKVTCRWDKREEGHTHQVATTWDGEVVCPGARVVLPEPETVDALPLLVDYLRSLAEALDGIAGGVRAMVDVLDQVER